jgi:hypothetical protein
MSYHFAVNVGVEKDGGRRTLSFAAKTTSLKCIAKIASKTVSRQNSAPSVATGQSAESAHATAARKPETSVEAVQNVMDALSDLVTIATASVEAAVDKASSKSVQAAKKASKDSIQAAKTVTRESLCAAKQATRGLGL